MLRVKNWSPYVGGIIIGVLQIPLVFLLNDTLGMSSAFSVFVAGIFSMIGKSCCDASSYVWQVGAAIGIALGVYTSSKLSKTKRPRISSVWLAEFGFKSLKMRYALSFVGGALMTFGARLANGCTSGNGISGTSQLDVSAWIALAGMFGAAVGTAFLMKIVFKKKV